MRIADIFVMCLYNFKLDLKFVVSLTANVRRGCDKSQKFASDYV